MLVSTNNDTCVKYSMETQAYKVVSTHAHEISGCTILSRLINSLAPHIGGLNDGVHSDLATLQFNNEEKLEDFHSIIPRIQQNINLSGENVSPTILIL